MIRHDLIEQVGGIEKAKAIVKQYEDLETCFEAYRYFDIEKDDFLRKPKLGRVDVIDLRTAIAEHDQTSVLPTSDRGFKVGDLVVLIQFANDFAREHDALYDLFDFENDLETLAVLSDRKGGEVRSSTEHLRHATPTEIKAGCRLDDTTDHVTDIRNHISPNMRVMDL